MKKYILITLMMLFVISLYAMPDAPMPNREPIHAKITEYLKLTDKQVKELTPIYEEWHKERMQMIMEMDSLTEYLNYLVKYDSQKTNKIKELSDEIIKKEKEIFDYNMKMEEKIMSYLTPVQKGRFLVWKHRMARRRPPIDDYPKRMP